jgi:holo-[acyl-carrier protein] synthase|tara:strand:+ start:1182 stop:1562 length:381 start_codon:yes stop_codon:yes gene_type:complete
MSVVGIGTDIIDISRISQMKSAVRDKLALRVLNEREYQYYLEVNHADRYLAKRWAAKEAASKALGTGIAKGVSFQHFDIQSLESGQPKLLLSGVALTYAKEMGAEHWHISLADEKEYATAFVTLSK